MNYITSYCTDKGIVKETNQDSFAIKIVSTKMGQVAFVVVCDGMGGLEKGELASKEVVMAFCNWFEHQFKWMLYQGFEVKKLQEQWGMLIEKLNEKLKMYGRKNGCKLGTTLTAMLFLLDKYYVLHIGDSRAYELTSDLQLLTKDHTWVEREVRNGRLTREEAREDKRRNILLQCIGASEKIAPDFMEGNIKRDAVYMLCSDGFRHEVTEQEMLEALSPGQLTDVEKMKCSCEKMVHILKERRECDNITAVLIRTY